MWTRTLGKSIYREKGAQVRKKERKVFFFFFLSSGSSLSRGKSGHKTQGNILKWMDPLDPPHGNGKD